MPNGTLRDGLTRVSPSQALRFQSACRRLLHLEQLGSAIVSWVDSSASVPALDSSLEARLAGARAIVRSARPAGPLSRTPSLRLDLVLDDRPADEYLAALRRQSDECEAAIFACAAPASQKLAAELCRVSLLWGREIAYEFLLNPRGGFAVASPRLQSLFPVICETFFGGDPGREEVLLRRCTESAVEFDLRRCPHERLDAPEETRDLACRLEADMLRGFVTALIPGITHRRARDQASCRDELALPT